MIGEDNSERARKPWIDLILCVGFFVLALAVRLLYLSQVKRIPLFYNLVSDSLSYDEWAQRIAAGDWLGRGVFYQAPLYPYFLGLLEAAVGRDLLLIRVVQAILGAASCTLLLLTGKYFFSRATGILAAFLLALYAPAIFFDGLIQKAVLDLFLITLLLLLLGRAQQRPSWIYFVTAGVVLGLLGLSRENALILAFVVIFWAWFYFTQQRPLIRLAWVGIFLVGLALVLVPVGLRNLEIGGEFMLTTSQLGTNFFIGNNPSANGMYASLRPGHADAQFERQDATEIAEQALRRPLSPGEVSTYWLGRALAFIQSHPTDWLRLMWKKWLITWNVREIEDSDDFYLYQQWSWLLKVLGGMNFGILAPIASLGIALTWRRWRKLWLLYLLLGSLAFSVALFYVFARYRFSIVPLVVLFAGAGLAELPVLFKEWKFRQLIVASAVLLLSLSIVQWPVIGRPGPSVAGYNNIGNAFMKLGMVKEAIENYQQALRIDPMSEVAHYNIGSLLGQQGELNAAGYHLREAIKGHPDYVEARSNLGNVLMMQGDLKGAIEQFREVLKVNPALSKTRFNLALAFIKGGYFKEARDELEQFLKVEPDSVEARYYLAIVLLGEGKLDRGVEQLEQVLRLQPELAEAHATLARVLAIQGKREEAMQHYQEALRILKSQRKAPVPRK